MLTIVEMNVHNATISVCLDFDWIGLVWDVDWVAHKLSLTCDDVEHFDWSSIFMRF